jgi:hypothetical protein
MYLRGDEIQYDYNLAQMNDITTTIKNKQVATTVKNNEKNNTVYNLDTRPYRRHGLGAHVGLGILLRLNEKVDFTAQARLEYQFTDAEYNDEILFSPADNKTLGVAQLKYVYGNYAKYMTDRTNNYSRPGTHPFSLGVQLGIRFYMFDSDRR